MKYLMSKKPHNRIDKQNADFVPGDGDIITGTPFARILKYATVEFTMDKTQSTRIGKYDLVLRMKSNASIIGGDDATGHFIAIKPGEAWDYIIPIPKDHPPGVYWYHTHGHMAAERQLMGGLSGTLVIEGLQDEVPATRPLVERLMALKEFSPGGGGKLNSVAKPVNGVVRSINGQVDPTIAMRPGETQLWRLSGQTANT